MHGNTEEIVEQLVVSLRTYPIINNAQNTMKHIPFILIIFLSTLKLVAQSNINPSISNFYEQYNTELIILAVLLFSFASYSIILNIKSAAIGPIQRRLNERNLIRNLRNLTPSDKAILAIFIDNNKAVHEFDPGDLSVAWLSSLKILFRAEGSGKDNRIPFRIALDAMAFLKRNPNILWEPPKA